MQTSPHINRSTQYLLTVVAILAVGVVASILIEISPIHRHTADTKQHGFCMPMIEDFCPGQPVARNVKKQRTLAFM